MILLVVGVGSFACGIWLGMTIVLASDSRLSDDLSIYGATDVETSERVWLEAGDRVRFCSRTGVVMNASSKSHRASVEWNLGVESYTDSVSQSMLTRIEKAATP